VRISGDGQTVTTLPVPGLYQPTGIAVSRDGTVYVANYGDSTATSSHPGEIVKITGLSPSSTPIALAIPSRGGQITGVR
jgi:DNA-binding beta-propeller fold protein YncE